MSKRFTPFKLNPLPKKKVKLFKFTKDTDTLLKKIKKDVIFDVYADVMNQNDSILYNKSMTIGNKQNKWRPFIDEQSCKYALNILNQILNGVGYSQNSDPSKTQQVKVKCIQIYSNIIKIN